MRNPVKRESLFLVELVLDLFIFVLCAAVCVGLLVHARSLSRQSTQLTDAVYLAQTAAETWKATGVLPGEMRPGADGLLLRAEERDGLLTITVIGSGGTIYQLEGVGRVG